MPWNNQTGGPGGGAQGPRGPWSRGPSGGGTPEFDELLRRGHEWLQQLIPRGRIKRSTLAAVGLGLFAVWLLSGIYFVTSTEQGFVMRFGKVVAHSSLGINYRLPWPIETDEVIEVGSAKELNIGSQTGTESGEQPIDVPAESLMLTADENIVDINFTVFWAVKDASAYLFNVDNPDKVIKSVAESAMRGVIGQRSYDSINSNRQAVESRVRDEIQRTLDFYGAGVVVTAVHLGSASAPEQVSRAAHEVEAARAEQDAVRNDAEGYASHAIVDARGQAAIIVQQAEAYRQKAIADARGEAQHFLSVYEEYKKAPEVTRRRMYLETMSQVLAPLNKVILDDPGGRSIVPYFPLSDLQKSRSNESVTVTPSPQPQITAGPQQ